MSSILITGASGFIGSFIVEEALNRNFEVWAGVRASSSKRYLKDSRIHFFTADFSNPTKLTEALSNHKESHGKFDIVVHCAGVTKCIEKSDFNNVFYGPATSVTYTLSMLDVPPIQ